MEDICVYCGQPIKETSMEHVIQQALGGRYESAHILCPQCNEIVGKCIDVPFNRIFNPIIDQLNDFVKQRKSSNPPYKGKARHDGVVYDVVIKNKRVVACPELSRKLRNNTKISTLDFEILSYEFDTDNDAFLMGLQKIAFNFALDKNVDFSKLQHGVDVVLNGKRIEEIRFKYPVVPFVPLNPIDRFLELETDVPSFFHNLILFTQEQHLWCYIDLFNTFQYYVLLSDKWDGENVIAESYLQVVQKIDRTVPEMRRWRPKYGLIYSAAYDVPSSPDRDTMKARVERAVRLEPYAKEMSKIISPMLGSKYLLNLVDPKLSEEEKREYGISFLLYFDENDQLIHSRYRQVTLGEFEWEIVSYPLKIMHAIKRREIDVPKYQNAKIERLNRYLITRKED